MNKKTKNCVAQENFLSPLSIPFIFCSRRGGGGGGFLDDAAADVDDSGSHVDSFGRPKE